MGYDRNILEKCALAEVEVEANNTKAVTASILECKRIELALQPPSVTNRGYAYRIIPNSLMT